MNYHEKFQQELRRQVQRQNFAKIGKITAVHLGGSYTVELGGGQTLNSLNSIALNSKFYVGQWVTLESFGGDWVIAGEGAQKGGS